MENKALIAISAGLLIVSSVQADTTWSNIRDGKTFFEVALGVASLTNNTNVESSLINIATYDESSNIAEITFGHYLTDNIFTKANIQKSIYDVFNITNIGFNASYQFDDNEFNPYIGVDIGYSTLVWDKSPVSNPVFEIGNSQSVYVGLSGGIEYTIDDDFLITGKVQYLIYDHETTINNEILSHESQANFIFGVKYVL